MALKPDDAGTDDERTVLRFLDMWKARDVEGMLATFTDDASYIDMPLPPRRGLAEIRTYIEALFTAFGVEIETLHIASNGPVIFTERVDYLTLDDGSRPPVPLPVTGVMEMRDGKIAVWRDYLDLGTAEAGLGLKIRSDAEPEVGA
ncbi:MAG: limonene-1,2-epoxide hydrolase family protein [Novosphingobium sp.]